MHAATSTARRAAVCTAVTAALGMGAQVALADQRAAAHDDDAILIEEIVVTVQRRPENLQEVPVSANVISGQVLREQNLNTLQDLSQTAPDVHVGQNGRSNETYIRGIGSGVNPSFDQSVGTFVDDIYHGRSRTTDATFLDLDRVEILKGPQTTFFGNNAIAGAFNIVTRKPSNDFDADFRALYGQYGQYAAEGEVGGSLIPDAVSARGAVLVDGMQGWLKNVFSNDHSPDQTNGALRLTLLFTPGPDWEVTLKNEVSRNRNNGAFPDQIVNCPPGAPFTAAGAFCKAAIAAGVPIGLNNNLTGSSPGQGIELSTVEEVLTVNYRHWGHTFTSVSGFSKYDYHLELDTDVNPAVLYQVQVPEAYHQFSQEFRVASPLGQTLEYLGGVYFQTDDLRSHLDQNYSFLDPVINGASKFAPLAPYEPIGTDGGFRQVEHSYAAFASATWHITSALSLSPGVRGSWVNKGFAGDLFYGTANTPYATQLTPLPQNLQPLASGLGLGAPNTMNLSRQDSAAQPSAKLQYRLSPAAMAYFSYARGFKSGGFNGTDTSGVVTNVPFAPEHVNAYEVGFKSEWLDQRLLFNIDAFRMDYSNLQVSFQKPLPSGTFEGVVNNAASARSQGGELQFQWVATRELRLEAQATYMNAYYVDYTNVSPTALQQLAGLKIQSLSGRPTQFSPHTTGALTATYTPTLPGSYHLTAQVSEYFSSAYYLTGTDDDLARQKTYSRLDARLTLSSPGKNWNFDVIGRNLTNQNILVFAAPMATSLGSFLEEKEMPRSIAAQIRYRW